MSERTFDRETLLDLTVNVVPLGIILFFVFVFLIIRPWEPDFFVTLISMALLVVPFVSLAFLTYLSGRTIAKAEQAEASAAAESRGELTDLESDSSTGANAEVTDGVSDDEAAALTDDGETDSEEERDGEPTTERDPE